MLFEPKRREITYIADDYVMQHGVIDEIYRIYERLVPG
jgi:hypothetical protein